MASRRTPRHRLPSNLPLSPCGPLMVELFTSPAFLRSTRAWSSARPWLSPARGSPQRHTLNEVMDSEPRGRICSIMPLTCFEHDGFDATRAGRKPKSVCIAPIQGKNRNWSEKSDRFGMRQSASLEASYPVVVFHRIERGDYSCGMTPSGLLPRASVENSKPVSRH